VTAFLRRSVTTVPVSIFAVLALMALAAVPTQANDTRGGGKTVTVVTHLEALVIINQCNNDVVNLHGDEYTTIRTTPTAHGYTVDSTIAAPNLTGNRVPVPPDTNAYAYKGQDVERSHQYVVTGPYPATNYDIHWTKLVPQANAPSMYLVLVFRETIDQYGTPVVLVDRAYLTCTQPCDR
jgi:hypothetical protein